MTSRDVDSPWMESISHTSEPDFYLTHTIWHNGYGKCPETGVRSVVDGVTVPNSFRLVQHGGFDFPFVESIILRGLRKGWDTYRIATLVEWLARRRRPRPTLFR